MLGIALAIAACAPASAPPAGGATATTPASSLFRPAASISTGTRIALGPAPANCAPTTFGKVSDQRGSGLGTSPVWVQGFEAAGDGAVLHVAPGAKDPRGLPTDVLWLIAPGFREQIELRAHSIESPELLWIGDPYGATQYGVLLPGAPSVLGDIAADGFVEFPMTLFIPRAACYVLEVRWPGGEWHASFVAGA